ncbi:hypothetical protein PoB_007585300 [Plakobranchus ocellatus]|uniref:Uncharacterized protein n=1 Tax=Plakobranchus ocellatus TaxID=259542 RepID=A0AAV4DYB4_9GAST|nr:hypothetical protein PoB_007585300 [Plakobranchus ocellatus]
MRRTQSDSEVSDVINRGVGNYTNCNKFDYIIDAKVYFRSYNTTSESVLKLPAISNSHNHKDSGNVISTNSNRTDPGIIIKSETILVVTATTETQICQDVNGFKRPLDCNNKWT